MSSPASRPAARLRWVDFGLLTSVGQNEAACAAMRAGVSRPSTLRRSWLDTETFDEVEVIGHPVRGFSEGFNLVGCWLRLARGALQALLRRPGVPPSTDAGYWARTALVGVLPAPSEPRFLDDEPDAGAFRDAFLEPFRAGSGLPIPSAHLAVFGRGRDALAAALLDFLARGQPQGVDRVLVVAVDTYLDPLTLDWLGATHRLKTLEDPTGLAPGEAAVCILLEREGGARRGDEALTLTIGPVAVGVRQVGSDDGASDAGKALAEVIERVLGSMPRNGSAEIDVIGDLNGETWRAAEWGNTLTRMARRIGRLRLHLPALSLGDTGAASAAVGLCRAVHMLRRGEAMGRAAIVISSNDTGGVACLGVERNGR